MFCDLRNVCISLYIGGVGRERVLLVVSVYYNLIPETRIRNQVETVFPNIRRKGEEVVKKEFERKLV